MKPDRKKEVKKVLSQEEYERKIAELQQELEELKKVKVEDNKPKKGEIWKPDASINEYYYYINELSDVRRTYNCNNSPNDQTRISNGNFYKTEEEAEYQAKVQKYTNLFKKYVEEHSDTLDWENGSQQKFYIYYNKTYGVISTDIDTTCARQGAIYSSSNKVLIDALSFIGRENAIKYLFNVKED